MPDPAAPPLDLDAIDPSYYYVHLFNAAAEQPNIVGALVARVRALEAEVARLQAPALTMTADTDCTILSLRARLPDGTEIDLPVG